VERHPRRGANLNRGAASCVPTMALLDGEFEKSDESRRQMTRALMTRNDARCNKKKKSPEPGSASGDFKINFRKTQEKLVAAHRRARQIPMACSDSGPANDNEK